jgi:hypothetical protein
MTVAPHLMTWDELAEHWRTSPRNARRMAKRARLRALDFGHRTKRLRMKDVEAAEERMAGEKEVMTNKKGSKSK